MKVEAKNEYKNFILKYILPILGINQNNNLKEIDEAPNNKYIFQKEDYLYFSTHVRTLYKIKCTHTISKDDLSLARSIIQTFFVVSEYNMDYKGKNINYVSTLQKKTNYEWAVQRGICSWMMGGVNEDTEKFLKILEKWSVQTYEGKKVTFGFLINPEASSKFNNSYGKFVDVLRDDFSAVFTDCIHSVMELDSNCNFCRYLSITETGSIEKCELSNRLPIRFANIIKKYVSGKTVGIFLLANGDIILSKNQEIKFVKRNLKWLNFSYNSFKNALKGFAQKNNISNKLIESIYASTLDVSFAHTGGIISIVKDIGMLTSGDDPILSKCDYLDSEITCQNIEKYFAETNKNYKKENKRYLVVNQDEIKKRLLKRMFLTNLIGDLNFIEMDRKLKCDLISLDGACILNKSGDVCSFGAIIKNDSGSSGGGRGAASKKLSRYGMAIKVSTDGYIELYLDGKPKYTIK